ncbi:MAG: CrcB family protein [Candidatus Cyclonatronum sp.]|uniref:fluoride efflux transporter FluC n=1 Tax=Cyclonatronum sp. TaxID=3024185 RepID=UPI0025BA18D4|nr:CrcB family protein [Cyclonatronum sp.]MCC5933533.1 CrcB family protein [Balneolales bacterium]MCH8486531.1 CrcB family protein [Cyclonatronum sp.]
MSTKVLFLLVMMAGGAGALCRYAVNEVTGRFIKTRYPFGTMVINTSGSFAAGFIAGYVLLHPAWMPDWAVIVLLSGFLGGYTTFSTWMLQSIDLLRLKTTLRFVLNIALSIAFGIAAAASGFALAGWVM